MRIIEALNILKPKSADVADLKAARAAFAKQYHPDVNPDGLEMMKLGNAAFDMLIQNLELVAREFATFTKDADEYDSIPAAIMEKFAAIRRAHGLIVELCGTWLWVSGATKENKDMMKAEGFRWCSKKMMWSWHPDTYRKLSRRGAWDISEIRETFGTQRMEQTGGFALDA